MTEPQDLDLLAALEELAGTRLLVDAAQAWATLHGRPPVGEEWPALRRALSRLEREGLVRTEPSMHAEVTDAGRAVLEPRSSA